MGPPQHPQVVQHRVKKHKAKWSMTVMMNARDLSRDDDFLSHLLVEHLGTDNAPLQVHKMDPSRRLPKHDPAEIMAIIKKYIIRKGGMSTSAQRVKRAVDALLEVPAVKQYLHKRSTAQINAFATHASRYFELYLPNGCIEISHTSRYSHRTGKSELCILATTPLKVGQVITDLKGSLAHLTMEEDEELKKTDTRRQNGARRDFSVIHSNQKNKSHLFLGPARFVNHDCEHNVELFRDGRIITFRVIKPIGVGDELTAHYGDGYFGKGNRYCLCATCEKYGRGGYAPDGEYDENMDDSSTDEETREERVRAGLGLTAKGNPNERRTRRGVYAILAEKDTDDEDGGGTGTPLNGMKSPSQEAEADSSKATSKMGSPAVVPVSILVSVSAPVSKSISDTDEKASDKPRGPLNNGREETAPAPAPQASRRSARTLEKGKGKGEPSSSSSTPQPSARRQGSQSVPGKRSSSLADAKNRSASNSKSATPAARLSSNGAEKPKLSGPRCDDCSVALSIIVNGNEHSSKKNKPRCTRCKRHYAIYGSPWPDRTRNLQPLSSSSESETEEEILGHKGLRDMKRRKTDSVLYASAAKVAHYSKWLGPDGGHRYMAHRALSKEGSPVVGSKRKWDDIQQEPEYIQTSIRQIISSSGLPLSKPLPGLFSRPSPVLLSRRSWTTTMFVDPEASKSSEKSQDASTSEKPKLATRSESRRLSTPSFTTGTIGGKRKREPLPDDKPKARVGKTFYMKNNKKRMPKGWVLLSSSEETEGDDLDNADDEREEEEKKPDKNSTSQTTIKVEADFTSATAALYGASPASSSKTVTQVTMNEGTRFSSRTPTAVEERTSPSKGNAVEKSTLHPVSPWRRPQLDGSPGRNDSPRTRSQTKRADFMSASLTAMNAVVPPDLKVDSGSPPGISFSGTTSESSVTTEQGHDQVNLTIVTEDLQKLSGGKIEGTYSTVTYTMKLPDERLQREALEVSNYIHGTASSIGHPDPRISWKPKYRYSETDGWLSDTEDD